MDNDICKTLRYNMMIFGAASELGFCGRVSKAVPCIVLVSSELAHFLQYFKPSRWIRVINGEKLLCNLATYGKHALENVFSCLFKGECGDFLILDVFLGL